MAQKSIPWGYLLGDDSLVGYVAKEDSSIRLAIAKASGMIVDGGIRTLAAFANMGPFYSVANRYAVTNPGAAANRIDVDTGASLACGVFHYNSASIGAVNDLTAPAANPRIDRVVVRVNFSAAAYVPANASAALFTVPAYTARVTIIHGAENVAPVAPALTQDTNRATYWDIPLYQYQISVAGAISAITDEREWVDAETKTLYIPCVGGWDFDAAEITFRLSGGDKVFGFGMVDNHECRTLGTFIIPKDFLDDATITSVVNPGGTGNLYAENICRYGQCGTAYNTHTDGGGGCTAEAVTQDFAECVHTLALSSAAVGDIVTVNYVRLAGNALDTVNADVAMLGWNVEYLGWR